MKLRKIITMGLAAIMAVSAISVTGFASEPQYTVVYENSNLLTTDAEIIENAVEDESISANSISENDFYYEDGKFYEFKCDTPKSVDQKVSILKNSDNTFVENHIKDVIVSGTLTTYEVDKNYEKYLVDGSYYSANAVQQMSNTATSASSAMTIKQTVNYCKSSDGRCVSVGTIYGKVLSCDTSSGITPQSMTMEEHVLHGGIYDSSGNWVGNKGSINRTSPTFTNVKVGDAYYKQYDIDNISNYYFLDGDIYHMYTVVNVTASRGVSASVRVNLKSVLE